MQFDLPRIRLGLYGALGLFQFFVFVFCCARLGYTLHLPRGDTLNGGRDFYDPVIVDLLVTSLCGMAWAAIIFWIILKRRENLPVKTFKHELIGTGLLWFWLLVGISIASSQFAAVPYCQVFEACRVLSALLAFGWLSWICLTLLWGATFLLSYTNGAWNHSLHGHWNGSPASSRPMSQVTTGFGAA
ncbi:hypothetical protein DL96DRAFT_1575010 [Flagelloscypha sp. PMI_526]|nr:hypothetical protein DL96DRAFT_1575010 [Flagelloscypha sp. PMI_526]